MICRPVFDCLKSLFCHCEKIGQGRSLPPTIICVDQLSTSWSVHFYIFKKTATAVQGQRIWHTNPCRYVNIIKRGFWPMLLKWKDSSWRPALDMWSWHFFSVKYIIKKPRQLHLTGFRLVEVGILWGWKEIGHGSLGPESFDILIHVVRLILLKSSFILKDRWQLDFD